MSVLAVVLQAASPLLEQVGVEPNVGEIAHYLRGALGAEAPGQPRAPTTPASVL
jgi:hypothetical protein